MTSLPFTQCYDLGRGKFRLTKTQINSLRVRIQVYGIKRLRSYNKNALYIKLV